MRRPLAIFAIGCALASVLLGTRLLEGRGERVPAGVYVPAFEGSERLLDIALTKGDGQAYAALARDPALAHPRAFTDGAPEEAYRAQRPLLPYLAWALSFGRRDLVPLALALLAVLAAGFLTWSAGELIRLHGGDPRWALTLLVIPPSMTAIAWMIPELLALALAVTALWVLDRAPGRTLAVAILLTAAVVTRETMLLVPAALGVHALFTGRLRQRLPIVLMPFAVWGAWATVVRLRLGSWPWAASHGRLSVPLRGVIEGRWESPAVWIALVAVVVCAVYGLAASRRRDHQLIIAAYALSATVMGPEIFSRWDGFTRPLLPLIAVAVLTMGIRSPRPLSRLRAAPA